MDLFLSRYNDFQYILKMPFRKGRKLLITILENEQKEKSWQVWLAKYPQMDSETYISFDEFYRQNKLQKVVKRTDEEVINDAENILKSMKHSK